MLSSLGQLRGLYQKELDKIIGSFSFERLSSSATRRETLEDTIGTVEGYSDIFKSDLPAMIAYILVTDCSLAIDSWFISNIEDLTSQHVSFTRSTDITVNKRKGLSDLPGVNILIKLHQETPVVPGFEIPRSPDASYSCIYTANEDEARDPPIVPQHLQHRVLSYPNNIYAGAPLPNPQHVVLNHLYIENREAPRSLVALGLSHRFRTKNITVVLYKPIKRR
ncbi:5-AMP-activated protein kinase, beta subunit, interaction domain-containing protein [Artemisia annua]|uniref:5-AMP-activated protein kinase, beta subunit, interaction domain-containing protein n=1 Tax=Artemisia annua TaxID=35608 RepID=A0A2U1LDL4_ARTAN|nr:5-AMP-activated protein kinase, beta subunit, interaction domain-containing protein [Artemisia annua]